ncbi:MAG: right-handed parallel beta-helix repeat-containing protein [Mycobacterium sp.]|nr:right-handed parallel beta-helix repeat-containing protein [Mycobacterium sp.]
MPKRETTARAGAVRRAVRLGGWVLVVFNCVAAVLVLGPLSPSVCAGDPKLDGSTLQAQLDALKPGDTLTLEPRVYEHDAVIRLTVPGVHIDGNGATLRATNDQTSAVQITADDVAVSDLNLTAPAEGQRWAGLDQHKIVVSGDRDTLTGVSVVGSAAAGVFITGAQGFRLDNVNVTGTRADGIHVTGGSTGGVLENVRTDQTGDDGIAVVSYGNESPCRDIHIAHATVGSTRWGRGIAVVGARDVSVQDFTIANTSSAGLYVASEGAPYFTDSVDAVTISRGSLTAANQDPGVIQGAILIYSGNAGRMVDNVRISDVTVTATPDSAGRDVGITVDSGSVSGISLTDISVNGSGVTPFDTNAPAGSVTTSGWTHDQNPITVG